ncbi:MAG: hypothetical protein M3220_20625 [Chloroflexota bacterium]|nr:hypothetical protein [Chloroflexota bacterium]
MNTSLTTADGQTVENPTQDDLARALDALLESEDESADLWLEDDAGWALSVVPTGDVFFENLEEEGYQTLGPLSRDYILRLLHLLSTGKIDELRAEPWEEGE